MQKRYIHGMAVCYACDTHLIGSCAICNVGVCNEHIAPNTLEIFLCPECKVKMVAMVQAELLQKVTWIRDMAWQEINKATESDWTSILMHALDDIAMLCKEQLKSKG